MSGTPGFKEWKLVCDLFEQGDSVLVLRKGGIAEGRQGFQWKHREFLLFPTSFHEQRDQLRLVPGGSSDMPSGGNQEQVEIRLWAELVETAEVTSLEEAFDLAPLHPWTEEVVRERFGWGDHPGLSVAVLRVSKLKQPWVLSNRPEFGGCRSWLSLPAEEGLNEGWRDDLQQVSKPTRIDEALEALASGTIHPGELAEG